jgi:hypothetical protein
MKNEMVTKKGFGMGAGLQKQIEVSHNELEIDKFEKEKSLQIFYL